jgi:predicted Zn-dependent protease with MMP-like domain
MRLGRAIKGGGNHGAMSREFTTAPSLDDIEAIARSAFDTLPDTFRMLTTGIVFRVDDFPDPETVMEMGLQSPFDLMGLYSGVPVGEKDAGAAPVVDMIFLYRRPLLDYWCETEEDLSHLVRHVLIHEIGLSDDDMERLEANAGD